ncbi:MAG: hypothetical protein ACD_23C00315G0004 [uncultured bacterium]|nr:MAG: hypothetical protein ACD_23C00315G0004 [uncultured bacterium]
MDDHYLRWRDPDLIDKFNSKEASKFFPSEKKFLTQINGDIASVLDIGCASGRYIDLLRLYINKFQYTGIDIVEQNIQIARSKFPEHKFVAGNALDVKLKDKFDLVNATGVIQHEPKFQDLIRKMVDWSNKYIIFDLKLANIEGYISDRQRAYTQYNSNRLYFIICSLQWLTDFLEGLPGIEKTFLYGYLTPTNKNVKLPSHVTKIISTGVLLEKGIGQVKNTYLELPMIHLGKQV